MNGILQCIYLYSQLHGVDPRVTQAVIKLESNFNVTAVGALGEQGLMQVRPEHVPVSIAQLRDPCTNIKYGTMILRRAMDNCKHKDDNTFVVCFNAGVAGGSRLKKPKQFDYYKKISAIIAMEQK